MTINHIDQLAQWWRDAEEGVGKAGDVVIERDDSPNFGAPSYVVFMLGRDEYENLTYRRILSRAPKPKPAWRDAVAVVAHVDDFRGAQRRVFVRRTADFGGICWEDEFSEWPSDELIEPVPLIEAKVTDAMIDRILDVIDARFDNYPAGIGEELAVAALGLETA